MDATQGASPRFWLWLQVCTITGRFRLERLWPESASRVALWSIRAGQPSLSREFFDTLLLILRTRQTREEGNHVIDLAFAQGKRLHIFIEPRVLYAISLVVMIHNVPQRGLRAVVKVWRCNEHVAQVRRLERRDVGLFLGDEETAQYRHVALNGSTIYVDQLARVDLLLCPARQCDDVMSNNPDANVVKIIVHEVGRISFFFCQGMAFVTPGFGIEE